MTRTRRSPNHSSRRMSRRAPGVTAVFVVVLLAAVACSSSDQTGVEPGGSDPAAMTAPAGLSSAQAASLANVLFDNLADQGATFTAVAASTVTDERVEVSGEVSWSTHIGHATVAAQGLEAGVTEVYWRGDSVLERRPAFNELMVTLGRGAVQFVARPPDPAGRDLDRVLALVVGLAGEQRDNPLLIQQEAGSTFLRADTLRGEAVEVLRYGQRNVYWLAVADGRLMRFEGNNATGNRPVVIDILERGPQEIPGPLAADVVPIETVGDIYEAASAGA